MTQTQTDLLTDISPETNQPPELDGSGALLYSQYRKNLGYYFEHYDSEQLSDYRKEVFNRVHQQKVFQERIFGRSSPQYETLPRNAFSSFVVSLHLVIFQSNYVFSSSPPGFEMTGDLGDDISRLLSSFDQGFLPCKLLDQLRKLDLVWYDGGLICAITDQRRESDQQTRVYLRANMDDVGAAGFDFEREYLFAQFPLICLDPSTQVGKIARVAANDRMKWQSSPYAEKTPAEFMQTEYPALFIEERTPIQPRLRREETVTDEELRERLMKKFGLA